jgi:prepilin-type N-terminal cleavage/methylation domain-containing protein
MPRINDRSAQRGFTVIELMVTVAIMAVIVGIASMTIANTLRQARLQAATRDLEGEIATIRNTARTQQMKVVAQITANRIMAFYDINDDGIYNVAVDFFDRNGNGVYDAGVDVPGMFLEHTYTNSIQFAVTSTGAAVPPLTTIRFNEMGNIVEAGNLLGANRVITVTMTSEPLRRYRITIATTGSTRVERSENAGADNYPTRPW